MKESHNRQPPNTKLIRLNKFKQMTEIGWVKKIEPLKNKSERKKKPELQES